MDIESVAVDIIKRAVDLDTKERYTEALVVYQEGLQVLNEKIRAENDENNKTYLRNKIEEHWNRVAAIKELIQKGKEEGNYCEQVHIENDSTGHGYKNLIGRFLDKEVEYVLIEDPNIRSFHQCQNFLLLCELLVKSCDNLRQIQLKTNKDAKSAANQKDWFYNLKTDLQKYGIQLTIIYSDSSYFRQIILSSGWMIKISRGLDIYKALNNKFCLGVYDLDLRQCHETKVNIVHTKDIKGHISLERSHRDAQHHKNRRGRLGPLEARRSDQSKPLVPRRGDRSKPRVAKRSDQSEPLVARHGEQSKPLMRLDAATGGDPEWNYFWRDATQPDLPDSDW
ncbi:MIT domain-containing protein 1-like isoform X2 [Maniola hyperantus]|uniref:MIT domain-containing protein 1-like isoform X2 n=1 Tax=Aphantopus hyperantus TaxID=2795564 RepID=UPI001568457F|nr:MIT domain-containing protein 1-like [Maniola hyperantus]